MTLQPTSFPDLNVTLLYEELNHTNESHCPHSEAWEWLNTGQPVYMMFIAVLGIVLNTLVLTVFFLQKKSCTVAEIYLGNLAAADLVLVSCLPFWAISYANDYNWPFGQFMCKAVNVGIKINVYSSIYFLVLISIDRYIALVHPMSHGRMRKPKYAWLGCLLMWGFGLIMSIPEFVFREVNYFPKYNNSGCFLYYPSKHFAVGFEAMLTVLNFIIPISIILFCTVKIIRVLRTKIMSRLNADKTKHKATTLMLVVLLAFLICWIPFHLVTIMIWLLRIEVLGGCYITNVVNICKLVSNYPAFFNSVLNPILYVIVGKNFRKKVTDLFKQCGVTKTPLSERGHSNLSSTQNTF
ncbi:B2 bradykinin receptor-like [Gouania willdenowi]|uniref:B2 bradykinin receptor n=1 Tax=Gouania willdenowi TaxID=441366 RepID=A0A8C5HK22_GOUWI|nr:B2 bradykinin receptor-like [Gouania willdenowi]